MRTDLLRRPLRILIVNAAFLFLAAGCATNMRSYNQDYGQNLPVAPKYTVANIDDTRFKITVHQGAPSSGPDHIVYLKEATAAIAQNEATHRGWKSWRVDYIQERDQGWMHILIADVTRESPAEMTPGNGNP
ncbi:MAG TPA: hypothetical protein VGY98_17505 [Verrucomicrobiae bacterium]|nr:hypothetical protein [Verrucomicrobiae bacterium]